MAQRGRFGGEAQFALDSGGIHLDDDAVDFVGEMLALRLPRVAIGEDFLDAVAELPIVGGAESQLLECFEGIGMFGERLKAIDEEVVGEKFEAALRGDGWIEHADGARGSIARIDENFAAHLFLMAVHRFEGFARHQDFAADFEGRLQFGFFDQGGVDAQRNGADRFHVWRDVFAGRAVAAGDAAHEDSVFVLQRNAEAVEFMLGDVFDFFAANSLPHAAIEIAEGLVGESVVEAEHRARVADGLKSGARSAADASGGRVGRDELRIGGFEFFEPVHQPVIGGVGELGLVEDVILIVVVADLVAELLDFLFCRNSLGHGTLVRTLT